jgi:hypothetical protein
MLEGVPDPANAYTQGVLQCARVISMEKLISKQIYAILIRKKNHTPTSKAYYNAKFPSIENNWLKIYTLPRKVTKNAYDKIFQYKILNNTLFLNKKLFLFGKSDTSLCSFCANVDEDAAHLFSACQHTTSLWSNLQIALSPNVLLANLNPKFALLGFYEASPNDFGLVNHILLLFKLYIYQSRSSKTLRLNGLLGKITEIAKLETMLAPIGTATYELYKTKWRPLNHLL